MYRYKYIWVFFRIYLGTESKNRFRNDDDGDDDTTVSIMKDGSYFLPQVLALADTVDKERKAAADALASANAETEEKAKAVEARQRRVEELEDQVERTEKVQWIQYPVQMVIICGRSGFKGGQQTWKNAVRYMLAVLRRDRDETAFELRREFSACYHPASARAGYRQKCLSRSGVGADRLKVMAAESCGYFNVHLYAHRVHVHSTEMRYSTRTPISLGSAASILASISMY